MIQPREDVALFWSAAPAETTAVPASQPPLTVININLWHDWPRHRRLPERLESFARHVEQRGAQIVLLQESIRTSELEAHIWLADRLGMQAVYHRANGNRERIGFEEGLAVLSAFPLGEIRFQTLQPSSGPFVRRVALGVEIETECGRFWVFTTHLSLTRARNAGQLRHLRSWVAEITADNAALIGGDFNADESSPQIQYLSRHWIDTFRSLYPKREALSHELRWPWGSSIQRHRLDYLFIKPGGAQWNILDTAYLDHGQEPYSDHKAVLTRFNPCHPN